MSFVPLSSYAIFYFCNVFFSNLKFLLADPGDYNNDHCPDLQLRATAKTVAKNCLNQNFDFFSFDCERLGTMQMMHLVSLCFSVLPAVCNVALLLVLIVFCIVVFCCDSLTLLCFSGDRDRAKCWYCNGGLQNWEANDEPFTEHAKWFPG